MSVTYACIQDLCECIVAIGLLSLAVLTSTGLLNALNGNFNTLQSQIGTALSQDDKYFPSDIIKHLNLEQQMIDECQSIGNTALLARSSSSHPNNLTGKHSICIHCKAMGHSTDTCWGPGGAMEGKRNEVMEKKWQDHANKLQSCPNMLNVSTYKDTSV